MRKKIILGAVLGGAVLLGALLRTLQEGDFVRASVRRPVFVFERQRPDFIVVPEKIPTPEEMPAGRSAPRKTGRPKASPGEGHDLDSIKKDISPKKGSVGDMKDYLDEAERARAERVRKSLGEIKEKVRDWHPDIFQPTW
ncbi:MAG: hypothetical protein ACOYJV_03665 [Aminivibrio sp.]